VRSASYYLERALQSGEQIEIGALRHAAEEARAEVLVLHNLFAQADVRGTSLKDFACTLLLAVISNTSLLLLQIGDGAVVVRVGGELKCLTEQLDREYVNEATFLVESTAINDAHVVDIAASKIDCVAIMSDGVQHLAVRYPSNEPFNEFFNPIFQYALSHGHLSEADRGAELDSLLSSEGVNSLTDDDKTLLLAVRELSPLPPLDSTEA
jgi:hypothetical protein